MDFNIKKSKKVDGVFIIKPTLSTDLRGNIWTSFLNDKIETLLPKNIKFVHDKFSLSKNNVLRGIHGDYKSWKLVTCVYGDIQQVVVDFREGSSTFLSWESFSVNRDNQLILLIPPKVGNAYYVKSNEAVYHYKYAYDGKYADVDQQFSVKWNDKNLRIKWISDTPILSDRDLKAQDYE